jgi:hypothetical protein
MRTQIFRLLQNLCASVKK